MAFDYIIWKDCRDGSVHIGTNDTGVAVACGVGPMQLTEAHNTTEVTCDDCRMYIVACMHYFMDHHAHQLNEGEEWQAGS